MKKKKNSIVAVQSPSHKTHLAVMTVWLSALAMPAVAFEVGHSRVSSAPGQPLIVVVPLTDLGSDDGSALSVKLADSTQWQASGLTPPVAINSMSVSIEPGSNPNSRLVRVISSQVSEQTVIDMLLDVQTASASRRVQASVIVAPPPTVRLAGQTVTVQRGDTLIGIAQQFPVQGANLYQELWALYSTNTKAFIKENMNLLRAGVSLRIPDADAVRAIDPAFAKAQYLAHVRAFRQGSGVTDGDLGIAAQAPPQTLQNQEPERQKGIVEAAVAEPDAPVADQVRLTPADAQGQAAQADAATSVQKQRAEETDRQQALVGNIEALKAAIAQANGSGQSVNSSDGQSNNGVSQAGNQSGSQMVNATGQTVNSDGQVIDSNGQVVNAGSVNQSGSPMVNAAGQTVNSDGQVIDSNGQVVATQSDAQSSGGSSQALKGAALAAGSNGQNGSDGSTNRVDGQSATASDVSADPAASSSPFARVSHWVSDNTMAAVALLLALIALILAWVLRASKSDVAEPMTQTANKASARFEKKLKEIDLSLDDTPEQAPTKTDTKG